MKVYGTVVDRCEAQRPSISCFNKCLLIGCDGLNVYKDGSVDVILNPVGLMDYFIVQHINVDAYLTGGYSD